VILVQVGEIIGLLPTVALVVATGAVGAVLARLEGLRTVWKIRADLARGQLPAEALFDGLAILLGGALLLTPGLLTDLLGFSLILPPSRRMLMGRVRENLRRRIKAGKGGPIQVSFFTVPGHEAGFPPGEPGPYPEDEREPV
jgi:UPF0716 protein FxsA